MIKVVGTVTKEERDEIERLYEKKSALENLIKIVDIKDNPTLYDKILSDYSLVLKQFNIWWEETSKKYQWEGDNWNINFETMEISQINE